jgi:hypothetical protein
MTRRILTILWPLLAGLNLLPTPVAAQTVLVPTTLTNAIKATDTHIVLGNWAGITVPGPNRSTLKNILIDDEMFEALAIDPPGTNYIHVIRGVRGTLRRTHAAGAKVWAGPTASFVAQDPKGTCTRTALAYVPLIVIPSFRAFDCMGGVFVRTDSVSASYNGTAIASGASATVTPPAETFKISGTSAISTITTPAGWGSGHCLNIIPTGNFTTLTGGNIGLASTAVTGVVLKMCFDIPAGQVWYPSY